MNVVIIDGYVDEPACFGVPPYISPYPRYIAGAFVNRGISPDNIHYFTIDQIRSTDSKSAVNISNAIKKSEVVVIVSGMTVPGKYLGYSPITSDEIVSIFKISSGIKILGGPVRFGYSLEGGTKAQNIPNLENDVFLSTKDIESFVFDIFYESHGKFNLLSKDRISNLNHRFRTNDEIAVWGKSGAFIITKHPQFPNILCEIETYRGCGQKTACSFCTEPMYGHPEFRKISDIVLEISSLYKHGAVRFRIGRQPDLFAFGGFETGNNTFIPNPAAIEELYSKIRAVAPNLKTLHMDNGNPKTISEYPSESLEILKTIIKYHTPGDVIAMGIESVDPKVILNNDLKASAQDAFEAISIVNSVGKKRGENGMPEILPGVNFVHGLLGESKNTLQLNYDFLENILKSDLYLRRINIRQAIVFKGTKLSSIDFRSPVSQKQFHNYKENVRKNIDMPMLQKIVPVGTILKDVYFEQTEDSKSFETGKISFGRQFGTYPLLIGTPGTIPPGTFKDVAVTGYGYRSISGVPVPLNINTASREMIRSLPFLSDKTADEIFIKRPFKNKNDLISRTEAEQTVLRFIDFDN